MHEGAISPTQHTKADTDNLKGLLQVHIKAHLNLQYHWTANGCIWLAVVLARNRDAFLFCKCLLAICGAFVDKCPLLRNHSSHGNRTKHYRMSLVIVLLLPIKINIILSFICQRPCCIIFVFANQLQWKQKALGQSLLSTYTKINPVRFNSNVPLLCRNSFILLLSGPIWLILTSVSNEARQINVRLQKGLWTTQANLISVSPLIVPRFHLRLLYTFIKCNASLMS